MIVGQIIFAYRTRLIDLLHNILNMDLVNIRLNVKSILSEIPSYIELVAAAKTRTVEEIQEAISSGVAIIGENYVQEAGKIFDIIGNKVKWHFIGHLQKNKVKKAVKIFDMIETVDNVDVAREIDLRSREVGRNMPILIEVNSGMEKSKFGVRDDKVEEFIISIAAFKNISVQGLMTMGPLKDDPEESRPYFRKVKNIFDNISLKKISAVKMRYLSMGMTNSYKVAIEEGANIVRIGAKIFGERGG